MTAIVRSSAVVFLVGLVALAGVMRSSAQAPRADVLLGRALNLDEVEGRLPQAIAAYQQVLSAPDATRGQKARAQFGIAQVYERLGRVEAREAYGVVVENYAGEDVALPAKAKLEAFGLTFEASTGSQAAKSERMLWTTEPLVKLALSPDGTKVAYSERTHDGIADLWLRDVVEGTAINLTNSTPRGSAGSGAANGPSWSPDGRTLAYSWLPRDNADPTDFINELRLFNLATGVHRTVPVDPRYDLFASPGPWAPDGQKVFAQVWLADLSGREKSASRRSAWVGIEDGVVELLDTSGELMARGTTGDDGRVAYSDGNDLYIADSPEAEPQLVRSFASGISVLGWHGDRLLTLTSLEGTTGLWLISPESLEQQVLLRSVDERERIVSTSQSGSVLLQTSPYSNTLVSSRRSHVNDTWRPGELLEFAAGEDFGLMPLAFSPDGQTLVHEEYPDGTLAFTSLSSNGGIRRLQTGIRIRGLTLPTWNAAGDATLLWVSEENAYFEVDAASGQARRVAEAVRTTGDIAIQPMAISGSAQFYFQRRRVRGEPDTLWRVDAATRAEVKIYEARSRLYAGPISADGNWLPILDSTGGREAVQDVVLVPTSGGPSRALCSFRTDGENDPTWAAGDTAVIVTKVELSPGQSQSSLWECSVNGGGPIALGITNNAEIWSVAAHPNGLELAYVAESIVPAEVWLLEGLLPPATPGGQ